MTIKHMVRWTQEENDIMQQMLREGASRKQIAIRLNRTAPAIQARIRKGEWHPKRHSLSETAKAERARIIGVIEDRLQIHRGFVMGALDAGVEPAPSIFHAMSELTGLLRELWQ